MKRFLLITIFFVGLIPNLKDMCFESAYEMKGQTLFGEDYKEPFPHCYICDGELVEKGFGIETVEYCPVCQFYCETCKNAFDRTVPEDEVIHNNSHGNENEGEDENENENENEDGNGNENGNGNSNNNGDNGQPEIVTYYNCLICNNFILLTREEAIKHTNLYGHRTYKEVQILQ